MQVITQNPFRVLGVLANATAKDIQREKAKAARFASVGKTLKPEFYLPKLELIEKIERNVSNIENAFSSLEQRKNKLQHALFWFVSNNQFDEIAIEYIVDDKEDKALETWEKVTHERQITNTNFSSFLNKSTLQLLSTDPEKQKKGIANKFELIYLPEFRKFVQLIIDETYKVDLNELSDSLINSIIKNKQTDKLESKEIYEIFEYCDFSTQDKVASIFCREHFIKIDELIKNIESTREENGDVLDDTIKLASEASVVLNKIKSFLGTDNLSYINSSDSVAREIITNSIHHYNSLYETKNDLEEETTLLLKKAFILAKKETTKSKISENILDMRERIKYRDEHKHFNVIANEFNKINESPKNFKNIEAFCISCVTELKALVEKNANFTNNKEYILATNAVTTIVMNYVAETLIRTNENLDDKKQLELIYSNSRKVLRKIKDLHMSDEVKADYRMAVKNINMKLEDLEKMDYPDYLRPLIILLSFLVLAIIALAI